MWFRGLLGELGAAPASALLLLVVRSQIYPFSLYAALVLLLGKVFAAALMCTS